MAELPYMQFFPADYLRDTEILSLSAQGGWMRMLCSMWHPSRRGVLSLRLQAMARLLHASEQTTRSMIDEIEDCGVAQVGWSADGERVTVTCRRIVRDWESASNARADISEKRAEAARARWAKERQNTGNPNADAFASPDAEQVQCPPESRIQIVEGERNAGVRRPSLVQAKSAASSIGVTPEMADEWWHAREASEWMKGAGGGGTTRVGSNWQADLKTYASRMGNAGGGKPQPAPKKLEKLEWEQ